MKIKEAKAKKLIEILIVIAIIALVTAIILGGSIKSRKEHPIINIEGCEYITFHNTYGSSATHKGNCTNNIHKLNK